MITGEDIGRLLNSLAERFCERRAYRCLFRFLPAMFSINGLTDGWCLCRDSLKDTRALCRDELKPDELTDINKAINLVDRMFEERDTLVSIQEKVAKEMRKNLESEL